MTKPPIVGYVVGTNEPIYSLPEMPGPPSSCVDNACGCARETPSLRELLDEICEIAGEMDEVAVDLHKELLALDGMKAVSPAESALQLSLQRESLVRQLAVASQGVMQLKALIGTANQFLS